MFLPGRKEIRHFGSLDKVVFGISVSTIGWTVLCAITSFVQSVLLDLVNLILQVICDLAVNVCADLYFTPVSEDFCLFWRGAQWPYGFVYL